MLDVQKISFSISTKLKEKYDSFKDELDLSLSAMYREALEDYIKQKERERWRNAAQKAKQDYESNAELREFSLIDGDEFYEY